MGILDGWRFCPRCMHELQPREGGRGHFVCPSCQASYWANSAPAVQGVLEREGHILLGRRKLEPRRGYWDLPGGFLEEGEEPVVGLKREFREETGLAIEPVELIGAFIDRYEHQYVLSLTWVVSGEGDPEAADDIELLAWFTPDRLPLEMAFESQDAVLRLWAARHTTP